MVSASSRKNVLIAAALGSSLAPFMVSALIVALPTIGREFGADTATLGWVTNIFFLAAAVFLVPLGRIADETGIKRIFTLGISVYAVSALFCVLAPDIRILILARFLTGAGAGMCFGTTIALVSLVYPGTERGKAIGVNVTAMALGFLLGFFLGGFLTYYTGWRSIFLVTIPLEIVILLLVLTRIPGECEIPRKREHDPAGMGLYAVTVLFLMAGFSLLPRTAGVLLMVAGGICAGIFVFQEKKARKPLLELGTLLKNRTFVTANLAALFFNTSNFGVFFLITLYLQSVRGMDARIAGIILLVPIIFMAALSPVAGRLADRTDPRMVIGAGVVSTSIALLLLSNLEEKTPFLLVIAALVLVGTGIALFQSPVVRTLVNSVPRQIYGLSSGMIETMRLMGMTISIALALIVFSLPGGGEGSSPGGLSANLSSLHAIFLAMFAVSVAALLLVMTLEGTPGSPAADKDANGS
ncbi:MAG TPA: MFS transporter [Methanoregula sp.]|nr:MFS transporter [Methanoregula sp.]